MTEKNQSLRDALLAADPATPALLENYRKEIAIMFDRKLSWPLRVGLGLIGAYSFWLGLIAVTFVWSGESTPPGVRLIFAGLSVGMSGLGAVLLFVAFRGSYRQMREGTIGAILALLTCAACGIACLQFLSEMGGEDFGIFIWRVVGAFFLGVAGLIALLWLRRRDSTKLEIRLLEMEYRLAALSERVEQQAPAKP